MESEVSFMNYSQLLEKAITESGLSLREIEKRCKDAGLNVTPSYISLLKNGKLPPPEPEITLALVKILEAKDESQLIFQGYFDKAPDVIKEYMAASSELNKVMLESLCEIKGDDEVTRAAKAFLAKLDVLTDVNFSSNLLPKKSPENIILPISSDEMEPTLPKSSTLSINPTNPSILKSKDIIVFKKGINTQVRRIYFTGDEILLITDNKHRELFKIQSFEDIEYIGRVIGYRLDF
jgi:hypothetical protein